jgi:hypothetical protein
MPLLERLCTGLTIPFYSGGVRSFWAVYVVEGTRWEHLGFLSRNGLFSRKLQGVIRNYSLIHLNKNL